MPSLSSSIDAFGDIPVDAHQPNVQGAETAGVIAIARVIKAQLGVMQLGVGLHHVAAFHEGLHRRLSVRRQYGAIPSFRAQLIHAARL